MDSISTYLSRLLYSSSTQLHTVHTSTTHLHNFCMHKHIHTFPSSKIADNDENN